MSIITKLSTLSRLVSRIKYGMRSSDHTMLLELTEDVYALQHMSALNTRFVPWSGSSLRPSALLTILNDILLKNRRRIVECGGGYSTILISRLLKMYVDRDKSAKLVTFEHDSDWVVKLRSFLQEEELDAVCNVVHAALVNNEYSLDGSQWYDEEKVHSALDESTVDLLVVDGPPAYLRNIALSRYPAVPVFLKYLKGDFTVILDDIHRKGELRILKKWGELLDLPVEIRKTNGSIGIIRSEPGPSY